MDRTRKFAGLANIASAVWAILCGGFILLDVSVFKWTMEQSKDLVGLVVPGTPVTSVNSLEFLKAIRERLEKKLA